MMHEYEKAFICRSEKDLIECQKYYIKKGYFWYSKRVFNEGGKQYYVNKDFEDRHLTPLFKPIVILLKSYNKTFGWVEYNKEIQFYDYYKDVVKFWINRKDKLKRLLEN